MGQVDAHGADLRAWDLVDHAGDVDRVIALIANDVVPHDQVAGERGKVNCVVFGAQGRTAGPRLDGDIYDREAASHAFGVDGGAGRTPDRDVINDDVVRRVSVRGVFDHDRRAGVV